MIRPIVKILLLFGQAAEILAMFQLQRSALPGMSAQSTSRLFRVVIFGGG